MNDPRNIQGLRRDILCAYEHFNDITKTKEYIMEELRNDYTDEKITEGLKIISI